MNFEASYHPHQERARAKAEDVEELLEQFPEENRERLEARLLDKTLNEQVSILQAALKGRRESLVRPRHVSAHLMMINKVSDHVFDQFSNTEHQIEVGRGENGRVFKYASAEDSGLTTVFKMRIRPPMGNENDLLSEAAYQADIAAFSDSQKATRVAVPHPYYVAASSKGYVLAMEEVPGYSIKDIREKDIPVPDTLDINTIEIALQTFVQNMNEAGYYHRDIREGNIMIDLNPATPTQPVAYLIDFGYATKRLNEPEAGSVLDDSYERVKIRTVLNTLRMRQKPHESAV